MGEGFLTALLSLSLSGLCLIGLAEGLERLLHAQLSPGMRRTLWLLVLFRLLCPWSLSGGLLDWGAEQLQRAAEHGERAESSALVAREEIPSQSVEIIVPAIGEQEDRVTAERALSALWAAGFLAALARRAAAYGLLRRALDRSMVQAGAAEQAVLRRLTQGERNPPELMVSRAAPGPMLVGLLRPRLVLPEGPLSQEELEGVLAHELAHWRHRDLWVKWLIGLVGRTGMATGDHLHFEVAVDGVLTDPLDYLDHQNGEIRELLLRAGD